MTILWETVLVKRIKRSGQPIFFLREPFSLANTFALHPYSLHIVSYWQTIRSFPPTITMLIVAPFCFDLLMISAAARRTYFLYFFQLFVSRSAALPKKRKAFAFSTAFFQIFPPAQHPEKRDFFVFELVSANFNTLKNGFRRTVG